ncbi:unnamed protein product, partial [Trichogramma brassicae]
MRLVRYTPGETFFRRLSDVFMKSRLILTFVKENHSTEWQLLIQEACRSIK